MSKTPKTQKPRISRGEITKRLGSILDVLCYLTPKSTISTEIVCTAHQGLCPRCAVFYLHQNMGKGFFFSHKKSAYHACLR